MVEEFDVTRFTCDTCKHFGDKCKCIDNAKIHFARPFFSCDVFREKHEICSAFDCVEYYTALRKEWESYNDFWEWYRLYLKQWHNGKKWWNTVNLIGIKPTKEGREVTDDVWEVQFDDFVNCMIMREDGIHYSNYRHLERTRSSPIGYHWVNEGPGVLKLEDDL